MAVIVSLDGGLSLTIRGCQPSLSAMSIRPTAARCQRMVMCICMDMCIDRVRVEVHGG
jgi:hypothetical protein